MPLGCYDQEHRSTQSREEVRVLALERFGVSMDEDLLSRFDERIRLAGYTSRSEAIRDVIRNYLVREEWDSEDADVVGTVALVYDHHTRQLEDKLTSVQHDHHQQIICSMHVHLDAHNCLEVIVLSGRAAEVRRLAEHLISTRGVKHGELICTTTGKEV